MNESVFHRAAQPARRKAITTYTEPQSETAPVEADSHAKSAKKLKPAAEKE